MQNMIDILLVKRVSYMLANQREWQSALYFISASGSGAAW